MREEKICYLIGHKMGELNDSGYPVCERCGCHSYYDEEVFANGGILIRPIYFVHRKLNSVKYVLIDWYKKFVLKETLPF